MIVQLGQRNRYWAPKSVPTTKMPIFVVEVGGEQPMEPWLLWNYLEAKLQRLIQEAGPEAGNVLEMSPEHMPDIAAIRADHLREEWATALMHSDRMSAAWGLIDWSRENRGKEVPQHVLAEVAEEQSLASLLEIL